MSSARVRRTIPLRAVWAAVVSAVLTVGLTACGPVDAGSAAAQALDREIQMIPEVQSVKARGNNTLPFRGTASAQVTLEQSTPDARVQEIMEKMRSVMDDYASRHEVTWKPSRLTIGDYTIPVFDDAAQNNASFALLGTLRGTDAFSGAKVSVPGRVSGQPGYLTVIAPDEKVIDALPRALDLIAAEPFLDGFGAMARSGDSQLSAVADDGLLPEMAIAAYRAVAEKYRVIETHLGGRLNMIRVENYEDVASATALAEKAAPGGVDTIQGGIVTRYGTGDFSDVDPLIHQLLQSGSASEIEVSPSSLDVIADKARIADVYRSLSANPSFSGVGNVGIWRGPVRKSNGVHASPAELGEAVRIFDALDIAAERRIEYYGRFEVMVDMKFIRDEAVREALGAVKKNVPDGAVVEFRHARNDSATFKVADRISVRKDPASKKVSRWGRQVEKMWAELPSR